MIDSLFTWLEAHPREGTLLYLVIVGVIAVLMLFIDWHFRTREARAIKRREKQQFAVELARRAEKRRQRDAEAKREADIRKFGLLQFPYERTRIKRDDIDPAYRTGQFNVPSTMRDMKHIEVKPR